MLAACAAGRGGTSCRPVYYIGTRSRCLPAAPSADGVAVLTCPPARPPALLLAATRYVILPKDFEKGYKANVKKSDTEFAFYN